MIVLLVWTIPICLAMGIFGWLLDRQLDRGHEIRWHDRFYGPQLPRRTGRVIDVDVSTGPRRPHRGEVLKYHRHLDGHAPGFRSSPRRSQV